MKPTQDTWVRLRITLLLCLFSFLFLIVLARAYQLQVVESPKLAALAERQSLKAIPLVPRRGILYDRKKEELAITMEVDAVFAQPGKIGNIREAAESIGSILGKRPASLQKKMREEKPFVWLERGITPAQRAAIEKLKIEGVNFLKETKRFYPQGEMGCHVIGFAGLDSQGLEGVELGYDEFIRGEPGYILLSKDGLGRAITPETPAFRHSEEGGEIILTIDKNIQYITEKELRKAVLACSAKGGMAIVMNPKTGEVLALAIQPSFDPNHFSSFSPQVLKNRTITDTFEPGSTLKAFLLAAVLEERAAAPSDVFYCENGTYGVGGKFIHDIHKYEWLSLREIIKVSSNIGASKVGQKLGRGKFHRYLKNFGFGSKTGIDLPGEVSGFLPAPQHWSEVGLANISFGQGISVTALQLNVAISAIANGGDLMRPYVAKAVLHRQGSILMENQPRVLRRVISPETAKAVASILRSVMEEGGTGRAASLSGYEAAGKTGTAQKALLNGRGYSDKRMGSFSGFAPVENPQVVISVIIDEPQGNSYGGVVAAPAFKAIAEQVLPCMGIYPKGVTYLARAVPRKVYSEEQKNPSVLHTQIKTSEVLEEPGIMPDFYGKSIRQVVQTAQRLGLDLKIEGSGRAVAQSPAPGQVLQGNQKGLVKFQPAI
ncbi:MAG: transpeptidase family protein [Deltaproteobacteria bacterium]|nr:transpeptidase family protein [Deltaproteobacteria bacterium]